MNTEIRRSFNKDEYIYTIQIDGISRYCKNVRSLNKECVDIGINNFYIERGDKNVCLILGNNRYILDNHICFYSQEFLNENREHLIICEESKDCSNWIKRIRKGKALLTIYNNPFSIISDKRIVTQNDRGNWGVFDLKNNAIVPYGKYSHIDGFKFKLAKVRKTIPNINWETEEETSFDLFGIIDINGNDVIECDYDIIYKFYGNDKWYTTLHKNGRHYKFHLGYRRFFGSISDVEWFQYLEERGTIKWEG